MSEHPKATQRPSGVQTIAGFLNDFGLIVSGLHRASDVSQATSPLYCAAETSCRKPGRKASVVAWSTRPVKSRRTRRPVNSKRWTVPSDDPAARCRPSGLKAADRRLFPAFRPRVMRPLRLPDMDDLVRGRGGDELTVRTERTRHRWFRERRAAGGFPRRGPRRRRQRSGHRRH